MPIYEYVCRDCGERLELLVRSDGRPKCSKCGSRKLEKQLSVPAAHSSSSSEGACPMQAEGLCQTGCCPARRPGGPCG